MIILLLLYYITVVASDGFISNNFDSARSRMHNPTIKSYSYMIFEMSGNYHKH
jgi:hypothetical protein